MRIISDNDNDKQRSRPRHCARRLNRTIVPIGHTHTKIMASSATADTELLTEHFGYPPVVSLFRDESLCFSSSPGYIVLADTHRRASSTTSSTVSTFSPNAPSIASNRPSSANHLSASASSPLLSNEDVAKKSCHKTRSRLLPKTPTVTRLRMARTSWRPCCVPPLTATLTNSSCTRCATFWW